MEKSNFPRSFKSVFILTGAGVSAESGLRTFRDHDGLWENHRIEDVATPEGFERNPALVHNFYNGLRKKLPLVHPNPAHVSIAEFEKYCDKKGIDFLLVTQNVDDLHQRAGSKKVIPMHGELLKALCTNCQGHFEFECLAKMDMDTDSICPDCKEKGHMRPDIIWFGEIPYGLETIEDKLRKCDLFISVGTSGVVYPAAGFVAAAFNAYKIEVNLEASANSWSFQEQRIGKAGELMPLLLGQLMEV